MSPESNRVEAASAGQWTVLFFFSNQKDLKEKKRKKGKKLQIPTTLKKK